MKMNWSVLLEELGTHTKADIKKRLDSVKAEMEEDAKDEQ